MRIRKTLAFFLPCCLLLTLAAVASAQVCNVKVVTDASPDYTDIPSLIHSSTSRWETPKEKCWALFYWNHINRRQTAPMWLHGTELCDPIMQWNDYGFTMCSTICGINCSVWEAMGLKVRHWEIQNHTVPEVFYDGRWHMYDNSMSALYTLCDGVTLAGTEDIGKTQGCPASGGKVEFGHIAKYHCLNGTGKNGFLTGADCARELKQEGICFNPNKIRNCNDLWWDRGHRYILNLHAGEVYTRYYHRLDADSPERVVQAEKGKQVYEADPAYFVPNMTKNPKLKGKDPEAASPRYRIRGNGLRTWAPDLENLKQAAYSTANVKVVGPAEGDSPISAPRKSGQSPGSNVTVQPEKAGQAGEAVFMVEGANVITSMEIKARLYRKSTADVARIWIGSPLWQKEGTWKLAAEHKAASGWEDVALRLIEPVNGSYAVLVKVELVGQSQAADAALQALEFRTVTQVNAKALPRLNIGRNTVYVGAGDQSEAVVLWPDMRGKGDRSNLPERPGGCCAQIGPVPVAEQNIATEEEHPQVCPGMHLKTPNEDGFVVFRLDTPRDVTRIVYGGRIANRGEGAHVDFLHSFDNGATWTRSYSLTDTNPPWDVIHYETVDKVPAGVRSVLFKYLLRSPEASPKGSGLFAVRVEADFQPAAAGFRPMEVTWTWNERQADYSTVPRSHVQRIEKVPCTYTVDVGGVDHPQMEAVRINLCGEKGTGPICRDGPEGAAHKLDLSPFPPAGPICRDGPEGAAHKLDQSPLSPGGAVQKYIPFWATYGTNFAEGKAYTLSIPSATEYKAGDQEGQRKLTDGIAWCSDGGGAAYSHGGYWHKPKDLLITVDLEQPRPCGAFRIHVHGWPWHDAIKGEFRDEVEVLTSADNQAFASQGFFDFKLRWKDLPANFMWPDSEQLQGHTFDLRLPKPVEARYVRFRVNSPRSVGITEVQALDFIKHEAFDLRVALPADSP